MSNPLRRLLRTRSLVLLAVVFMIALVIAYRDGANRAQHARKTHKVLVTFEGPWAFARDPNDANSVFASRRKPAAIAIWLYSLPRTSLPRAKRSLREFTSSRCRRF